MLKINSDQKPKNRIKLIGNEYVAFGFNKKSTMLRSRKFDIKIQLDFL